MNRFVQLDYSNQHLGVTRIASALEAVQRLRHWFSGTRGLATLLLSAVAAAAMVIVYQLIDSVTEGHWLAMWIVMWLAAFAVLTVFASRARDLACKPRG